MALIYIMYKKILLIDDDTDEQFFFTEALKEINTPVKFYYANGAKEGLHLFDILSPDYVFIDLNMPAFNGMQCLDAIKHTISNQHANLIIYSTGLDEVVCADAIRKGANACIKKQPGIHELANVLQNFLVD